jgi:outer membrane protein OmpA-like peptidoglycan-associated protein
MYYRRKIGILLILAFILPIIIGCGCSATRPSNINQNEIEYLRQKVSELERKLETQDSRFDQVLGSVPDSISRWKDQYRQSGLMEQTFSSSYYEKIDSAELYFGVDQYKLGDIERNELDRIAQHMAEAPASILSIEGHTDGSGADFYNQQLSENRAEAVKQYLITKYDIPIHRLQTAAMGSSEQKYSSDTGNKPNRNRRAEAHLILLSSSHGK